MFYFIMILFVLGNAIKPSKHYKTYHKVLKPIQPVNNVEQKLPDYEIPKWVYKKVFKYNKPNKYNS